MKDHKDNHHEHQHGHDHQQYHDHQKLTKRYVDPICGMSTDDADAFIPYEHDGETHYFCSSHCLDKIIDAPST
ncbi:MAG: YHS domain-containing protein [Xanthomonadaceae bacterium]|nr:YHS domain-containing protein [Xanthomonadaceae bacterium]